MEDREPYITGGKKMSREIKFRAWQDNQMCIQPMSGTYAMGRFIGFLYEDAPLMQYTGLLDKNGKEIYEGDIVKEETAWGSERNLEVKLDEEIRYALYEEGVFFHWLYEIINGGDSDNYSIEIIGNIYEHKNILDKD